MMWLPARIVFTFRALERMLSTGIQGVCMRYFWIALCMGALSVPVFAQNNDLSPAELPPPDFEGREYVDSRGCVFLRSTFGGEVTWIPRYGPDRQPVCNGAPTLAEQPTPPEQEPVEQAAQPAATPTPAPAPEAPVPVAVAPMQQPQVAPAPRRVATASRPRVQRQVLPRADASGRHPSCPASAPYGQLVDTTLGRPLVRCVTSPSLFLAPIVNGSIYDPQAPIALPDGSSARQTSHTVAAPRIAHGAHGRVVQVGSFSVPANATRLRARLQQAGLPARIHVSRGLHVVTAGPFAASQDAQSALARVRGMGFSDAFLRR